MRALALLLSLLLVLVPLTAAQDGEGGSSSSSSDSSSSSSDSSSSSSSPSPEPKPSPSPTPGRGDGCPMPGEAPDTPEETRACQERFCRQNPDNDRCQKEAAEEEPDEAADQGPIEWRRWCRDEAREDVQRERCRAALGDFGAVREGRWVSFRVDAANASLLDYRVDGMLVAQSIHLETGSDNLTVHASGSALRIGDADTELVIHDDPTGLVRLKGKDGSLTILLPSDADVQHSADGSVARITYAGGRIGHLRSDNATFLDDHTVLASGFLALLVPHQRQEGAPPPGQPDGREHADRAEQVNHAIEDRKIGAEITLHAPPPHAAAMSDGAAGNDSVKVLAYDDVEVQVQLPSGGVATKEAPIRIEVSAELDEGRTIVLNVNRSLLESSDAESLVLAYFDLHDQPDGSVLETEVVFHQAASLQDVLDPTDDGGSPEYWVVEDANGLQVLASVPHWSAHAITVSSLAGLAQPSVVVGVLVGVAGSVVAATMLFWPRRPEDE